MSYNTYLYFFYQARKTLRNFAASNSSYTSISPSNKFYEMKPLVECTFYLYILLVSSNL